MRCTEYYNQSLVSTDAWAWSDYSAHGFENMMNEETDMLNAMIKSLPTELPQIFDTVLFELTHALVDGSGSEPAY